MKGTRKESVENQTPAFIDKPIQLLKARQWFNIKKEQLHNAWQKLPAAEQGRTHLRLCMDPIFKRYTLVVKTSDPASKGAGLRTMDTPQKKLEASEELFWGHKSFNKSPLHPRFKAFFHPTEVAFAYLHQLTGWLWCAEYRYVHELCRSFRNHVPESQLKELFQWLHSIAYSYACYIYTRLGDMVYDYIHGFYEFVGAVVYCNINQWLATAVYDYILHVTEWIESVINSYAIWYFQSRKSEMDILHPGLLDPPKNVLHTRADSRIVSHV